MSFFLDLVIQTMSAEREICNIYSDKVDASDRIRGINEDAVVNLMKSMAKEGQINPIWVRPWDYERNTHKLVIGLHRLEAARRFRTSPGLHGGDGRLGLRPVCSFSAGQARARAAIPPRLPSRSKLDRRPA